MNGVRDKWKMNGLADLDVCDVLNLRIHSQKCRKGNVLIDGDFVKRIAGFYHIGFI